MKGILLEGIRPGGGGMTKFFSGWGGLPPTFPVGKTLDSAHQPYLTFSVTFFLVASITFFHEGMSLVCFIFVFDAFVILLVFPQSLLNCWCCVYTFFPLVLALMFLLSLLL